MQVLINDPDKALRHYLGVLLVQMPGLVVAFLFVRYFVVYATDELLIAPALVGTLMLAIKIFDGVSDPVIAWISDARRGLRRQPLFLLGAPLFLAMIGIWLPPVGLQGALLVAWLAAFLMAFELGQTLRSVPAGALGLEVARTAERRAFIRVFIAVVTFVGALGSILLMQALIDAPDPRALLERTMIPAVIVVTLITIASATQLKELPVEQPGERRPIIAMLREVLAIPYHRQFIGVQMAETLAYGAVAFSVFYVTAWILEAPGMTMYIFITAMVTTLLSVPLWWKIVPRLGTRRTWLAGQYLWAATLLCWPLVLLFGIVPFFALAIFAGVARGAGDVAGYAMLGDLADYDATRSGRERQGIYLTTYSLIGKLVDAANIFLLGWMLQFAGYDPTATAQGQGFTVAMSFAICLIPLAAILASIRILRRYSLYADTGIGDGREERRARADAGRAVASPA